MGQKQSTAQARSRTYSTTGQNENGPTTSSGGTSGNLHRNRAVSLGNVPSASNGHGLSIPGQGDSDSSPEEGIIRLHPSSFPVHMFNFQGIKCPVCNKFMQPGDIEVHLVMCLTKPRIRYNEDVLTEDKGECVICFEDLKQGDTIARLPCLCIYHKPCIDAWFEVNRSCPEHPQD